MNHTTIPTHRSNSRPLLRAMAALILLALAGLAFAVRIKDVTRPVVLDLEFNGATSDPWGGVRLGFSAATDIDRTEFGVTWNTALDGGGVVVGNRVRIEIEAEAVLAS